MLGRTKTCVIKAILAIVVVLAAVVYYQASEEAVEDVATPALETAPAPAAPPPAHTHTVSRIRPAETRSFIVLAATA